MPLCLDKRISGSPLRSPVLLMLMMLLCGGGLALAQDPFEIHIYEYEPMTWGEYSLEAHLNFDPQGTSIAMERCCPTAQSDPSDAGADRWDSRRSSRLGFMFLNAWEPGYSSAICRLAGSAAFLRAGVVASAGPAWFCRGILVSEHAV